MNLATPEAFRALGIPLLEGRIFLDSDREGAPRVCVVSRRLAEDFWPDASAIGETLTVDSRLFEIVGVVGDVHQIGLSAASQPAFYTPLAQWRWFSDLWVVARATSGAESLLPEVRNLVSELAPRVPITELQTMESVLRRSNRLQRASSRLFLAFAILALFLGAVGVYGVLSMTIAGKRRELAVRIAVGAPARSIFRHVFSSALPPLISGLVVGVVAAVLLAREISEMLIKVSPSDPAIFASTITLVSVVAGIAIWIPARRATQTQPSEALRVE
jgi:putative ABC transport system permease protein